LTSFFTIGPKASTEKNSLRVWLKPFMEMGTPVKA